MKIIVTEDSVRSRNIHSLLTVICNDLLTFKIYHILLWHNHLEIVSFLRLPTETIQLNIRLLTRELLAAVHCLFHNSVLERVSDEHKIPVLRINL